MTTLLIRRLRPPMYGFIRRSLTLGLALAATLLVEPAVGQYKPDATAMVKDLNAVTRTENRMTVVMWLPTEFWQATLESGGKLPASEIDRFTRELDPYVLIAVADGQMGLFGSMNFAEPELLKNAVTIENTRGTVLSPLPDDEISGGVRNLTQMMRPVLSNMMGSLGGHLAFVVFAGADKAGHRTVEPTKEGTFIVHVGTVAVRYRLPLGSLLPPAIDAKTGESFPGNYHFNPFTGSKLSPAPASGSKAPTAPAAAPTAPSGPTGSQ